MEYMYNGILFSHKKEQSSDACYNMNESWKQKPKHETKVYILYDSIYTGQNIQNR